MYSEDIAPFYEKFSISAACYVLERCEWEEECQLPVRFHVEAVAPSYEKRRNVPFECTFADEAVLIP